jgi:hypothetical protein
MNRKSLLIQLLVASALTGCVSNPSSVPLQSNVVSQNPIDRIVPDAGPTMIGSNAMPAAESAKLDDRNKKSTASKLIKEVWNKDCNSIRVTLRASFQGAPNSWHVKCQNSKLDYDYLIILPAPRAPNGQVLPCYKSQSGSMACSVSARPRS